MYLFFLPESAWSEFFGRKLLSGRKVGFYMLFEKNALRCKFFCHFNKYSYICSPAKYARSCNQLNLSAEKRKMDKLKKSLAMQLFIN